MVGGSTGPVFRGSSLIHGGGSSSKETGVNKLVGGGDEKEIKWSILDLISRG